MIDRDGYRPNVGIILVNSRNDVFWGKRVKEHAWQFPQGGIKAGREPGAGDVPRAGGRGRAESRARAASSGARATGCATTCRATGCVATGAPTIAVKSRSGICCAWSGATATCVCAAPTSPSSTPGAGASIGFRWRAWSSSSARSTSRPCPSSRAICLPWRQCAPVRRPRASNRFRRIPNCLQQIAHLLRTTPHRLRQTKTSRRLRSPLARAYRRQPQRLRQVCRLDQDQKAHIALRPESRGIFQHRQRRCEIERRPPCKSIHSPRAGARACCRAARRTRSNNRRAHPSSFRTRAESAASCAATARKRRLSRTALTADVKQLDVLETTQRAHVARCAQRRSSR